MILKISFWNPEKHRKNFIKILEKNSYDLYFKIDDHSIAKLWIIKLQDSLNKNFTLETVFAAFNLERSSKKVLLKKLKNCIDIINSSWLNKKHNYFIEPIKGNYDVNEHNRIHHHFEILMGQVWNRSDWYQKIHASGDLELLNAVRGINDLTHQIEAIKFNVPYLSTTFLNDDIIKDELPDEANDYFVLESNFGDIFLHYAQLGKTWIEIILDDDNEIFDSNISPLRKISGEFDISFGCTFKNKIKTINKIITKIKEKGKDPYDKTLRLGRLKVGSIILQDKKEKILDNICKNDQILSISIIDEDKMFPKNAILHQEFLPYYDPY